MSSRFVTCAAASIRKPILELATWEWCEERPQAFTRRFGREVVGLNLIRQMDHTNRNMGRS